MYIWGYFAVTQIFATVSTLLGAAKEAKGVSVLKCLRIFVCLQMYVCMYKEAQGLSVSEICVCMHVHVYMYV